MDNNITFEEEQQLSLFITYLIPNTITGDKSTTELGLKFLNFCDEIYLKTKGNSNITIKHIFPDL